MKNQTCHRETCQNTVLKNPNIYCSSECSTLHKTELKIQTYLDGTWDGSHKGGLSATIRNFLLKEANYSCNKCGFNTFHPVDGACVLEINHINGDNKNHNRSNLEVLCPNCHSLTPNYRSRNIGQGRVLRRQAEALQNNPKYLGKITASPETLQFLKDNHPDKIYTITEKKTSICKCGKEKSRKASQCLECKLKEVSDKGAFHTTPPEELIQRLQTESYTKVAADYGVADNTLRAYLIARGCELPQKHGNKTCPECGVNVIGAVAPYYCEAHKPKFNIEWPEVDEVVSLIKQFGVKKFMADYNIEYVSTVRKFLARKDKLDGVNLSVKYLGV